MAIKVQKIPEKAVNSRQMQYAVLVNGRIVGIIWKMRDTASTKDSWKVVWGGKTRGTTFSRTKAIDAVAHQKTPNKGYSYDTEEESMKLATRRYKRGR